MHPTPPRRRFAPSALLVALALPATSSLAGAQQVVDPGAEPPRRTLAGVVVDAAGQPVAGAAVTLAGAIAAPVWATPPDVLRATTDERGRFRAEVRECVEYSAWAATPMQVSQLVAGIVPGPRHELRLQFEPPQPVPVHDLGSWQDRGPLRARLWLAGGSGLRREVAIADGAVLLPADWPMAAYEFELLAGDGAVLCTVRSGTHVDGLSVPRPRTIDVLVEDPAGLPVAGAELWFESGTREQLVDVGITGHRRRLVVGTTGADGRCACLVGSRWVGDDPRCSVSLHAGKTGYAEAYGGWDHSKRLFSEGLQPDAALTDDGALRLRLRPERRLAGRLTAGDRPIANCEVMVSSTRLVHLEAAHVAYHVETRARATTDADGGFVVHGLGADGIEHVHIATHPGVWGASLPRAAAPDQPLLAVHEASERLQLDTAACCRVSVQALTADGGPAASAAMLVLPLVGEPDYPGLDDARYRLDPAGRTTLLLQRDVDWLLFVIDGTRVASQVIRPDAAESDLELRVTELSRLRIHVTDPAGKPVVGARVSYRSYSYQQAPTAAESQLRMIAIQLYQRWFRRYESGADGWLALPMFDPDWTDFRVAAEAPGVTSAPWRLRFTEDPIELTVR